LNNVSSSEANTIVIWDAQAWRFNCCHLLILFSKLFPVQAMWTSVWTLTPASTTLLGNLGACLACVGRLTVKLEEKISTFPMLFVDQPMLSILVTWVLRQTYPTPTAVPGPTVLLILIFTPIRSTQVRQALRKLLPIKVLESYVLSKLCLFKAKSYQSYILNWHFWLS